MASTAAAWADVAAMCALADESDGESDGNESESETDESVGGGALALK